MWIVVWHWSLIMFECRSASDASFGIKYRGCLAVLDTTKHNWRMRWSRGEVIWNGSQTLQRHITSAIHAKQSILTATTIIVYCLIVIRESPNGIYTLTLHFKIGSPFHSILIRPFWGEMQLGKIGFSEMGLCKSGGTLMDFPFRGETHIKSVEGAKWPDAVYTIHSFWQIIYAHFLIFRWGLFTRFSCYLDAWVTTREYRALWTCVRSSVWT